MFQFIFNYFTLLIFISIKLFDLDIIRNVYTGEYSSFKLVKLKEGYESKLTLTAKRFSLKCTSKQLLYENDFFQCIIAEKEALNGLDNPFIVKLITDFEDYNYVYFLMEEINGNDLYSILMECTKFDENGSKFYTASVLLAFKDIHSKRLAYRDLKVSQYVALLENIINFVLIPSSLKTLW